MVILGGEGAGLADPVMTRADGAMTIPMQRPVEIVERGAVRRRSPCYTKLYEKPTSTSKDECHC